MKSMYLPITRYILAILLFLIAGNGYAQRAITWKGGTPGKNSDWYCPQNWSSTSVPDEFSDVIIPDVSTSSLALPMIQSGQVEVNSITIYSNGGLTISKNARLVVLSYAKGVNARNVKGEGFLLQNNYLSMKSKSMMIYMARENQFDLLTSFDQNRNSKHP